MSTKLKINLLSFILVLIMLASWILNMGLLRFGLTFYLVPLTLPILFIISNNISCKYFPTSKWIKIVTLISIITFLPPHLLVADIGDIGKLYLCFGLIVSNEVAFFTMPIGITLFFINVVAIVCQLIMAIVLKSASRKESSISKE